MSAISAQRHFATLKRADGYKYGDIFLWHPAMFVRNRFLSRQIFAAIACRPRTRVSSRREINYFLELVSELYYIQSVYGASIKKKWEVGSRSNQKRSSQRTDYSAVFSVFQRTTVTMDWGMAWGVLSPAYPLSPMLSEYLLHRHSEPSIVVGQVYVCRERNCCAISRLFPA
jgi:hypothetical protein